MPSPLPTHTIATGLETHAIIEIDPVDSDHLISYLTDFQYVLSFELGIIIFFLVLTWLFMVMNLKNND